jgi:hypothetical protein
LFWNSSSCVAENGWNDYDRTINTLCLSLSRGPFSFGGSIQF